MRVPDPNTFAGDVLVRQPGDKDWTPAEPQHRQDLARGTGLADMARAIQVDRAHRVSGALAYHVLDVMVALEEASAQNQHITVSSTCERPAALPTGLDRGALD